MIESLLPLLPVMTGRGELLFVGGGMTLGGVLWLSGARFSRSLLALLACSVGGILAYQVPGWFTLPLDPMATCVAGALILGIVGFLSHSFLTALGMGVILGLWCGLGLLASTGAPDSFSWPDYVTSGSISQFAIDAWHAMPIRAVHFLPWCCGAGMLAGITIGMVWQKVSVVLLWSMAGITMLLIPALSALRSSRPQYLTHGPHTGWSQALLLGALVAFGAIFQWRAAPEEGPMRPPAPVPQPRPVMNVASGKRPQKPKFRMALDD